MARTNVFTYPDDDDRDGAAVRVGWFDPDSCESFDEGTRWDGNNHVSLHTGSQYDHQILYRTPGARWVLEQWSQWQGRPRTFRFLTDDQAREWLLLAENDDAVETYFGKLEEENGPGRPAIEDGVAFPVKFPGALLTKVDTAAKDAGISRAEWLRRAAAAQLEGRH